MQSAVEPPPADQLAAMESWLARSPEHVTVTVARQDIARFAISIGAHDLRHYDQSAARRLGFPDVVAPDLFYIALRTSVFNLVPVQELHAEGTPLRDLPPIAFNQAMAGKTDAVLVRPFVAGDVVSCSRRSLSLETKNGRTGRLFLLDFEYRYEDVDARPIAIERFVRVFR